MNRIAGALFSLSLVLAGCAGPSLPRPPYDCSAGHVDPAAAERLTFERVNRMRARAALPALGWDDELADIARAYSRQLADADQGLTHAGFSRRRDTAARRLGVVRVAENLAVSCGDADNASGLAVEGWMDSSPHRKRILENFQFSGIGVAQAASGYLYFTFLFATYR